MANIASKWTRFMAVGCNHAKYICPKAEAAVLRFKAAFKPELTVHLGDTCDTTAFRSGARGIDSDSADPVMPDIDGGLEFLRKIRADIFLCGNHEDRLWNLRNSPNAVIAYASHRAIQAIEDGCRKIGCRVIPYGGIFQEYKRADVLFTHGTIYNEMVARDMATAYGGKVVFAHTHRAMQMPGKTIKPSMGFCTGTLTKRRELGYAKNRLATLAWGMGIVAGEFREGKNPASSVNLFNGPSEGDGNDEWRLPI